MDSIQSINPFSRRENPSPGCVTAYRVLTILSWVLSVITSIYYAHESPHDGKYARRSIWDQNRVYHSAFSMNSVITSLYFLVLFIVQLVYVGHLFSPDETKRNNAASVGSHFIANNLLHFAFVMLLVRSFFGWAELILIVNFFNLSACYFRHNTYSRFIHWPAVSAPLAWTFVAIYWNGAMMVHHPTSLVARIFGNIFIWSILAYGALCLFLYKDYTMGFSLSVLSASIGVGQFLTKAIALQWIFAFVIMACLFVASAVIAGMIWTGKEIKFRGSEPQADAERAPLLAE
ncbi:uncharacterized protein MKZ38_009632 [Zalerion maritima]|uniref:Uncharacterized protein n=1 Tax=Zalerion maritima TaxID=339359 RepID=A0AAD5S1F4_9PEZI|nr:uncharacterized protein MKZ38_009632 [Zalerion maritima]